MKPLDRHKLDVFNQTRSSSERVRGRRGQFTPESKLIEFVGLSIWAAVHSGLIPLNSRELETSPNQP